jgi:hypothetical protein
MSSVLQSCSLVGACFLCPYRGALLDLTINYHLSTTATVPMSVFGGGGCHFMKHCPCICEQCHMFIVNDLSFCINFGTRSCSE